MDKLKALNIGAINVEKKEKGFVQVYNKPIQELGNLNTIGLLTYILMLPDDWVLRKTHLHKQFTRRTVDNAWKHLVAENYAIDISFYAEGYGKGRIHLYKVSDEKYTDEDIYNYYENVKKAFTESNVIINEDTVEVGNNVDMNGFSFNVQNVQYKNYSTKCTTTKNLDNKDTLTNTKDIKIDDDKRTHSPSSENTNIQQVGNSKVIESVEAEEDIQVIIETLRESTKNDLPAVSFNSVLRKVMDMYHQNKIGQGNFRGT